MYVRLNLYAAAARACLADTAVTVIRSPRPEPLARQLGIANSVHRRIVARRPQDGRLRQYPGMMLL